MPLIKYIFIIFDIIVIHVLGFDFIYINSLMLSD